MGSLESHPGTLSSHPGTLCRAPINLQSNSGFGWISFVWVLGALLRVYRVRGGRMGPGSAPAPGGLGGLEGFSLLAERASSGKQRGSCSGRMDYQHDEPRFPIQL